MASAAPPTPFDAVAADYDRSFGRNPIGLVFRHVVQRRLEARYGKDASLVVNAEGEFFQVSLSFPAESQEKT